MPEARGYLLCLDTGFRIHPKTPFVPLLNLHMTNTQTKQSWGEDLTAFHISFPFNLRPSQNIVTAGNPLVLQFLLDIHISLDVLHSQTCIHPFAITDFNPSPLLLSSHNCYLLWSILSSSVWNSHEQNKLHFSKCFLKKVQYSQINFLQNKIWKASTTNITPLKSHLIPLKIPCAKIETLSRKIVGVKCPHLFCICEV